MTTQYTYVDEVDTAIAYRRRTMQLEAARELEHQKQALIKRNEDRINSDLLDSMQLQNNPMFVYKEPHRTAVEEQMYQHGQDMQREAQRQIGIPAGLGLACATISGMSNHYEEQLEREQRRDRFRSRRNIEKPKPKTFKDELEDEVKEWLKGVLDDI